MKTWMKGEITENCERQVYHRTTCKDYESKKCIHGVKRFLRNSILLPAMTYGSDLDVE